MIEVRCAQPEDLLSCLDLTARFHAASPVSDVAPFDRDAALQTALDAASTPDELKRLLDAQ